MSKFNLKKEIISICFLLATIVVSVVSYSHLPESVVSHWNFQGIADGWSSKNFHSIFFPCLIIGMYILFLVLPLIDPRKERYKDFDKVYNIFKTVMVAVLFLVYLFATIYNLGYKINIGIFVGSTIGLMMILLGNYMGKIKNNYFVGIKNPWTLSSENVWNKTHRFGGIMFIIFGAIIIICPYLNRDLAVILFLLGVFLCVFATSIYSYIVYRKEKTS